MKSAVLLLGALLAMAIGMPHAVHAGPLYKVTVIGGAGSAAYDINSAGQVVGSLAAGANQHGFLHDGTALLDLGTLGGANSIAWALNDSGTVVGTSDTVNAFAGFTYANGVLTALPDNLFSARDINQAGTIVGTGGFGDGLGHAYTYANGVITDLGVLPGIDSDGSFGYGINNAGKAVGEVIVGGPPNRPTQPFLYSGSVMQDLGDFGGIFSEARAINDHDQVVGAAGGPYLGDGNLYPYKAFLWEGGVLRMLGAMSPNGDSFANDINNAGQVVGEARAAQGVIRAFLYENGSMVPLESLIDSAAGWTITAANGINDLQQIAATGCRLGACYAVRLDLTAAIPEPAHLSMLGAGLLVLALRHGRRRRLSPASLRASFPAPAPTTLS